MNIISIITIGALAIGGYKYFKEENFHKKVNDTVTNVSNAIKETAGNIKEKVFNRKK